MKSGFWSVLFWMVIAAAFIGPGTVTTASAAGAAHGYSLLWALLFSTIACLVLQEAAARITIASGLTLGQAVRRRFAWSGIAWFLAVSVFLGCAAYEAGNILGAISGIVLVVTGIQPAVFTGVIVLVCGSVLWWGRAGTVANIMGVVVAIMGFAFLVTGLSTPVRGSALAAGLFVPSLPEGSVLLTLSLMGTTIVPYNLFLGSGLARGHAVRSMRFGLTFAILLGGMISMSIVLAGTTVEGTFSFENLALALENSQGRWMALLFAIGLFAAGFTSSITAPLAAAITLKSVSDHGEKREWAVRGRRYRTSWGLVLLTGLVFGVTNVKPIPVIILAQAVNGFILPVIAVFLWLMVNNPALVREYVNPLWVNILMAVTVWVTALFGFINIFKAVYSVIGADFTFEGAERIALLTLSSLVLLAAVFLVRRESKQFS